MASQIACQLYTLREFTKTPADIAKTLARVKKIGYDAVQVSALGPIDPNELAKLLKNEGLACCATHTSIERLRDNAQEIIDQHKLWGCSYAALGYHAVASAAGWTDFAKEFSQMAARLAAGGINLGYHNHSRELIRYDGLTGLEIFFKNSSKDVWMEIDTYWIAYGGGDPAAWIEKVSGRIPCVHLKDLGIDADGKQQMREVGDGNLNWPRIIHACRKAGVKWYIIEQDNCNGSDHFDCIERSLKNLRAMGVQ
ncbi:MAG: sugar phosphate isomerase/epimerase [Burkholderiales bacterium]|nr:sugar phosphate isomerase/epimerase [Phycisphaerae bacterium]